MRFALLLMIFTIPVQAQYQLTGKIYDHQTKTGIAFVSIGFPGKTIGTVSDEYGNFSLSIPENKELDSMKFMVVGYTTKAIPFVLLKQNQTNEISLQPAYYELNEVVIKPKNLKYKKLGNTKYSKNNCTGFADIGGNWKGSEAAVLFENNKEVFLEYFAFYIIQNKYNDSLKFRLKFYQTTNKNWVGTLIQNKAVIFKVGASTGETKISLSEYNIRLKHDFFVSLECLEDELDIRKFCYSGSLKTPSYYKVKAFSKWHSTRGTNNGGGGADFNLMVAYTK